jgi:hypothetical protein
MLAKLWEHFLHGLGFGMGFVIAGGLLSLIASFIMAVLARVH